MELVVDALVVSITCPDGPALLLPRQRLKLAGAKDKQRAMTEKGDCSLRTASKDASEVSLWVISNRIAVSERCPLCPR